MALAMRFMSGMIFVSLSLEPLTVIGVLATLAAATAAACYVPGRRALRIEPAAALRRD